MNVSFCKLCDIKIKNYYNVCDDCVKKNVFLHITELINYKFTRKDYNNLTNYYLSNKIYSNDGTLDKSYYGTHYLESDIKTYVKTNKKYIKRMSLLKEKTEHNISDKNNIKQFNEYLRNQRELFVITVLSKSGYDGPLFKYNYGLICNYIDGGKTYGKSLYELEIEIIKMVDKNNFIKYNELEKNNKINSIESILFIKHDVLLKCKLYELYINHDIDYVNNFNYHINTFDDLIDYLIDYFNL
jgi:hypothetical protein